ncbi:MAG: hypothetical protein ACI8QS_002461 [Planctomycetota bacterium]|jgi:hypothetical protein
MVPTVRTITRGALVVVRLVQSASASRRGPWSAQRDRTIRAVLLVGRGQWLRPPFVTRRCSVTGATPEASVRREVAARELGSLLAARPSMRCWTALAPNRPHGALKLSTEGDARTQPGLRFSATRGRWAASCGHPRIEGKRRGNGLFAHHHQVRLPRTA